MEIRVTGSLTPLIQSDCIRDYISAMLTNGADTSIMGGVDATEPVKTLTGNGIRRHPMATINQLYCPEGFKILLELLHEKGCSPFVITNNIVNKLGDFTSNKSDFSSLMFGYLDISPDSKLFSIISPCFDYFYTTTALYKRKPFDLMIDALKHYPRCITQLYFNVNTGSAIIGNREDVNAIIGNREDVNAIISDDMNDYVTIITVQVTDITNESLSKTNLWKIK